LQTSLPFFVGKIAGARQCQHRIDRLVGFSFWHEAVRFFPGPLNLHIGAGALIAPRRRALRSRGYGLGHVASRLETSGIFIAKRTAEMLAGGELNCVMDVGIAQARVQSIAFGAGAILLVKKQERAVAYHWI
jgi:hypothetical protein